MVSLKDGKQLVAEMFVVGSYEDFSTEKIIEVLVLADDLYFNDEESFLDDSQYDALKQYAHRLDPTNVYFTGVGSQVRGGKIPLPYQMGSLDQAYQGDYVKWITANKLADELVVISDKLDGTSVMSVYGIDGKLQIGYSRGDGFRGADWTRHLTKIHNVPQMIDNGGEPLTIRAENIIAPDQFKMINTGIFTRNGRIYRNCRNMVSGLMNSSENHPKLYTVIDMIAYEIVGSKLSKLDQLKKLKQLGFSVVSYSVKKASDLTDETLTELLNVRRKLSSYELDGIVLDIDSATTRVRLNDNSMNPPYARKFKIADVSNYAVATVVEVQWNLSKDGYYKPRLKLNPVDLVGATIQHCTGFNAKFIKDNEIGPGCKIALVRSGDVIPFCQTVLTPAPHGAQMPDDDTAIWTDTGVDLIVTDAATNPIVRFEQLNDFFASIDVPGLGSGNLQQMFDMGFTVPEKIIPLTQEDIGSLVGSSVIGKKIFKAMRERFTNIPMYDLMGSHASMGRGVGKRKMKKLYEAFEGDMSKCESVINITQVEGFEHKTASKIVAGYPTFMEFFEKMKPYLSVAPYVEKKQGNMSGKTVIFTGFRSAELEAKIIDAGGKMGTAVSKNTTYLVTAESNSTSGKAQKAQDLGVTVIGVEELKAML